MDRAPRPTKRTGWRARRRRVRSKKAGMETEIPEIAGEEEDDWKPSLTTIPFGPYLAAGAIVCMVFAPALERELVAYWKHATATETPTP